MANKAMRGTTQETTILGTLREMVRTDAKAYFICWKYAPELLPSSAVGSFDDLKKHYKALESPNKTEAFCNNWLLEKNVQEAVKFLKGRLYQRDLLDLYDVFLQKAKNEGDVQSFKAFVEFGEKFFKDSSENELKKILNNIDIPEEINDKNTI